jgi:hypothetical protein
MQNFSKKVNFVKAYSVKFSEKPITLIFQKINFFIAFCVEFLSKVKLVKAYSIENESHMPGNSNKNAHLLRRLFCSVPFDAAVQ